MKKFLEAVESLYHKGTLSSIQATALASIVKKQIIPLYVEIGAFLYVGVAFFLIGIGTTIKKYFSELGHIVIISALSAGTIGPLYYCFRKGNSYAPTKVPAPNMTFHYILYLGCVLSGLLVTYLEYHFRLLGNLWEHYLLVSSGFFFLLAYRFDNRFVLSLALGTLAAWFGFSLKDWGLSFHHYHRQYAIAYGVFTALLGFLLYRLEIKRHFLDLFLTFSTQFLFIALVSGVIRHQFSLYTLFLFVLVAATVYLSLRTNRFPYMVYAVLYGYVGFSAVVLDIIDTHIELFVFSYFIFSSIGVLILLTILSRKFKERA